MTIKEVKKKVAESVNKDWLQDYSIQLNYPLINFSASLKGVISIFEFVTQQIEGYEKYQNLPPELTTTRQKFINVRNNIVHLINTEDVAANSWNNNLAIITDGDMPFFVYNSPEAEFLINVYEKYPNNYQGAYDYIKGVTNNPNDKGYFDGYLLAYEFASKDFSKLAERKDAEKRSIASTRSDFQTQLNNSELELTEYLAQANQKFIDYSAAIDKFKNTKEELYNNWFDNTSGEFKAFNESSHDKVKELESLYREKLKLEAPAKY